jgi:hypothetical protein
MLMKGQYIVFQGRQPHGGCTYHEESWHAAIHLHVDSRHHVRIKGKVELADTEYHATERLRCEFEKFAQSMATARANGWEDCFQFGKGLINDFNQE